MKKFLSFLAIGALVLGMASCGDNNAPEKTELKVIGLPDNFVKCMYDESLFEEKGYLNFLFHTNPNYQPKEAGKASAAVDGTCLCVCLYPKDPNNFVGTYSIKDKNMTAWRDIAKDHQWTYYDTAASQGTIIVTQNADKSYKFEIDLTLAEISPYKGIITGIRK